MDLNLNKTYFYFYYNFISLKRLYSGWRWLGKELNRTRRIVCIYFKQLSKEKKCYYMLFKYIVKLLESLPYQDKSLNYMFSSAELN